MSSCHTRGIGIIYLSATLTSYKEQVYTDLLYLQRHSYRIWYDDGIVGGDNWRKIISDKIAGCSQFLLFVSKDFCVSYDVQAEINLALDLHKKVLLLRTARSLP